MEDPITSEEKKKKLVDQLKAEKAKKLETATRVSALLQSNSLQPDQSSPSPPTDANGSPPSRNSVVMEKQCGHVVAYRIDSCADELDISDSIINFLYNSVFLSIRNNSRTLEAVGGCILNSIGEAQISPMLKRMRTSAACAIYVLGSCKMNNLAL